MVPQNLLHAPLAATKNNGYKGSTQLLSGGSYLIKIYRLVDIFITTMVLISLHLSLNLVSLPGSIAEWLATKITITNLLVLLLCGFIWQRLLTACQLYNLARIESFKEETRRLLQASLGGGLLSVISFWAAAEGGVGRALFYFWSTLLISLLGGRCIVRLLALDLTPLGKQPRRVLVLGSGPRALQLYRWMVGSADSNYDVAGFLDSRPIEQMSNAVRLRLLGGLEQLEEVLTSNIMDEVLIALPIKSCYNQIQQAIQTCERLGIECKYLSDIFQVSHARPQIENHSHFPFVSMKMVSDDYRLLVKRALDVMGATTALVLFAPLMLLTMAAIRLTSQGPVVFVQQRYGLNRRRFKMLKFRTMVVNAESLQANLESQNEAQGPVFKIKNDPRVTPIGRWLRKTSIDELPQLINVLRGDMSLVGPRPLPERDVARFSESSLLRRFSVKPGLTCLWQISGRSNTEFGHWVKQDLQYIDQWSLWLDCTILLKTIPAVLKGRGAV